MNEILETERRTNRLLAHILIKGEKQEAAIAILAKVGFQPKEIASLLSTSSGTVRVTLVKLRKTKKGSKCPKKLERLKNI
jgi:DNA-binding NarL/FixJ family response regulator